MTTRYTGDCCPACGSYQVIPYAVLVGGSEEYGYQWSAPGSLEAVTSGKVGAHGIQEAASR